MCKIVIAFPSLNRQEGANSTAESARDACFDTVHICYQTKPRPFSLVQQEVLREAFNLPDKPDFVVLAADVCDFTPEAHKVILSFIDASGREDTDFIVGLRIGNIHEKENCHEFCYPVIGREFAERFDDFQLHCPEYWHFYADTELGLFAKEIGRFEYFSVPVLNLRHVNAKTAKPDTTYRSSRRFINQDHEVWRRRQEKGFLWGRTFETVGDIWCDV